MITSVLFLTYLDLSRASFDQFIESDVSLTVIRFSFICEGVCVSLVAPGDWSMTDHCVYSLLLTSPRQPRLVGSLAAMPSSRNNVHAVGFKRDLLESLHSTS